MKDFKTFNDFVVESDLALRAKELEQYRQEKEAKIKARKRRTQERDKVTTQGIRGTHKGKWGTFKGGVFTPDD